MSLSSRFTLIDQRAHVYVRVIGRLKTFNGINELQATHIRPVRDMHEPFFHCLEAMAVFVSNQRVSMRNTWCANDRKLTTKL